MGGGGLEVHRTREKNCCMFRFLKTHILYVGGDKLYLLEASDLHASFSLPLYIQRDVHCW